ncbi:hypothetical protein Bca52824_072667 [Brassica carinata]|uniref:Uncharacterized protein n=1 Tax=Brassica carinata TaxID=52824 RepID=A0A8X7Q9L3_BRACI|nr:hypothetical protein Bca52824_072667 [Brassica carinata]
MMPAILEYEIRETWITIVCPLKMEGIDEVAPPSATGEDFPMEKKQWVLGQHRTRNLVVLDK